MSSSAAPRPAPGGTRAAAVTSGGGSRRAPGRVRGAGAQSRAGWLLVAPFMLLFVVFYALPALAAAAFSLTDIGAADLRHPFEVDFTGLGTVLDVLSATGFQRSLLNTGMFLVIGVPVTMAIGLVMALALDSGITRLKATFRAAVYIPVVTNIVAAAVIWQYAFSVGGPVNSALGQLSDHVPNWLGDPPWAISSVLMLAVWRNVGTCMVLFLAGLQAIPEEVHEAAAMDGAGFLRRQLHMTLPLLRPTTLLVSVLMSVGFMNLFDEPYLVTSGGPLNSTKTIALWVYQQFGFGQVAQAMAGSMILLVLVALLGAAQLRLLRPKD